MKVRLNILVSTKESSGPYIEKAHAYFPEAEIILHAISPSTIKLMLKQGKSEPFLITGALFPSLLLRKFREQDYLFFNVDPKVNYNEAWEWHRLLNELSKGNFPKVNKDSHELFLRIISKLPKHKKAYIFGTGHSLQEAIKINWDDGYKIVCNTIVKDRALWNHINPNFIVAGDAVYHFSMSKHAVTFRRDLKKRLSETSTYFIYPYLFHSFVAHEFKGYESRLIPISSSTRKGIGYDLKNDFVLPDNPNVLGLLLLPIACTLAKNIYLWGFDGRAPTDEGFWKNSVGQSYPNLMKELIEDHPAFFAHYTPVGNEGKYAKEVQGDSLDRLLTESEKEGYTFTMMHKSWSPALNKRYTIRHEKEDSK